MLLKAVALTFTESSDWELDGKWVCSHEVHRFLYNWDINHFDADFTIEVHDRPGKERIQAKVYWSRGRIPYLLLTARDCPGRWYGQIPDLRFQDSEILNRYLKPFIGKTVYLQIVIN